MKSLRLYRVVGSIAHISAGAVIALTDEQLAPRRHRLAIVETVEGGAVVRAEQPLEFKVGEILGLAEAPEKAQAERLVPVDGGDDGRERLGSRTPKATASKPARPPKKVAAPKPEGSAAAAPTAASKIDGAAAAAASAVAPKPEGAAAEAAAAASPAAQPDGASQPAGAK